ncbi:hypothetical protein MNBD_NITROSPINAE02-285 [hydrothermal vent metagenome]|uniref:Uncharacterized protein n=1 Tax=hydrothermal vent metagenome TaxID=652676 RepID=A0A3B1CRC5_9ZZZZ
MFFKDVGYLLIGAIILFAAAPPSFAEEKEKEETIQEEKYFNEMIDSVKDMGALLMKVTSYLKELPRNEKVRKEIIGLLKKMEDTLRGWRHKLEKRGIEPETT